ncbi:proline iminopeptidase-family hydrolase [Dyella sp. GSA-30]|uniref:proline iminopeptidase-family hydrolase n=1 Tax=Dyella sp. GSA-30 TaxID=2994496 RepID=UPI0024912447|nr:proline iminopeptidase-family hydrolase [Dyella sp. GSA-30]BDU22655.1 proline iminopeptidase [Dyella sp. GSA-30]
MKRYVVALVALLGACFSLATQAVESSPKPGSYFDQTGRDDVLAGGVKMIEITTPKGKFHVWTKRVGNNPKLKVLLLHGGPGATHEYFEAFDSYFPGAGIEYYYYDQLGSAYSDQPKDDALWTTDRFVEEVEQVRQALHLDRDNFCLLGHSWGGVLAIEYALKYQQHLKCLVISDMVDSIPAYNEYATKVLMPKMDQAKLAEVKKLEAEHKTDDPRYMDILIPMHYEQHLLRMPHDQWPDPVNRAFGHLNEHLYQLMQGPSELGASGRLLNWDRSKDLHRIDVPTLVIAAQYDTMDPAYMAQMAKRLPKGQFLLCPKGSHMAMYDDQQTYFNGLIGFLKNVEQHD